MTSNPNNKQALKMLAAFGSVGVTAFDITMTDLAGEKVAFQSGRSLTEMSQTMNSRLDSATLKQQNFIIRPRKHDAAPTIIQLDDLDSAAAERISQYAFMVLCTSPGNHQAWIAVQDAPPDFARRLRKGSGADPTASGATRVSGSLNFKMKFAPAFPMVTITQANPGNIVTAATLDHAGLVAPPEATPARVSSRVSQPTYRGARKWPSYVRCLENAPPVHQGDRRDVSRADFTWCMTAIDWGWSVQATAARLMEESEKARENGDGYPSRGCAPVAALHPHPSPRCRRSRRPSTSSPPHS